VKGTRCVGAGIGTHEVVGGHLGSGRVAAAGERVGVGALIGIVSPEFSGANAAMLRLNPWGWRVMGRGEFIAFSKLSP
jgi:hypothetical protein